jgi:hypothetical protein
MSTRFAQVARLAYWGGRAFVSEHARAVVPIAVITQPIAFAMIVVGLTGDSSPSAVLGSIGAGCLGLWTVALGAASWGSWLERRSGRLAALAISPAAIWNVLAGYLGAAVLVGMSGVLVATVATPTLFGFWGTGANLAGLAAAFVALQLSVMSAAGTLLPFFVTSDSSLIWFETLIYPAAIVGAFLFPLDRLPRFLAPLGYAFPPQWGMRAMRAAFGDGDLSVSLLGVAGTSACWVGVGLVLARRAERLARAEGRLPLV